MELARERWRTKGNSHGNGKTDFRHPISSTNVRHGRRRQSRSAPASVLGVRRQAPDIETKFETELSTLREQYLSEVLNIHSAKEADGVDMSGLRPLIKGYFAALRLIVGAVMSSACLMRVV